MNSGIARLKPKGTKMEIIKVKTVFGGTIHVRAENLEWAKANNRLVCSCDKNGKNILHRSGRAEGTPKLWHVDNLLTNACRQVANGRA